MERFRRGADAAIVGPIPLQPSRFHERAEPAVVPQRSAEFLERRHRQSIVLVHCHVVRIPRRRQSSLERRGLHLARVGKPRVRLASPFGVVQRRQFGCPRGRNTRLVRFVGRASTPEHRAQCAEFVRARAHERRPGGAPLLGGAWLTSPFGVSSDASFGRPRGGNSRLVRFCGARVDARVPRAVRRVCARNGCARTPKGGSQGGRGEFFSTGEEPQRSNPWWAFGTRGKLRASAIFFVAKRLCRVVTNLSFLCARTY